jgi:hypothetical protein
LCPQGDGSAPLQPQEVSDAAERIAFLALTDPNDRPVQPCRMDKVHNASQKLPHSPLARHYDAVGPENISMVEMLKRFSEYQGKAKFRPVFIDYRNMERVLNVKSLGNLNRQFVSLLRAEQSSETPIIGNPAVWEGLLGEGHKLTTLDAAFRTPQGEAVNKSMSRMFPYITTLRWVLDNPRVIQPGINLSLEILHSWIFGPPDSITKHHNKSTNK